MEFADVLRRRKMVRSYSDEPVPREVVERIVARGRKAPSGGFSQGLRLVVVTKPETRRRIAELGQEPEYVKQGFAPWISQAPVHVVVAMREDDYHDRYRKPDKLLEDGSEITWHVPWWWVDAGKAMMLLLLAAVDEGLGAGLFGLFPAENNEQLRELLGLPEDVTVVGVVTIGHPGPEGAQGSRRFGWKPLEEVVRWEHW
ncbi:MAG TPA: nitroreductase family protein [Gaiellaceae bacterium]|nr:nitroreductase family protein [Gaiellaceae bacterium]